LDGFYKAILIGLFFAVRASSCLVVLNCKWNAVLFWGFNAQWKSKSN